MAIMPSLMAGAFFVAYARTSIHARDEGGPSHNVLRTSRAPFKAGRSTRRQCPQWVGLKSAKLEMFAPLSVSPERLAQLVAFLKTLGLDPTARGGPGASAEVLSPIDEALCHSSLGEPIHHVRLEFLGDAVLRLAATEFLRREHGSLPVGEQSALRSQLVSDRWLAELAAASGLSTVLRLGPMAAAMLQDKQLFWPSGFVISNQLRPHPPSLPPSSPQIPRMGRMASLIP